MTRMLRSGNAILMGVKILRETEAAHAATAKGTTKLTRRKLHEILGHCGKDTGELTAISLGLELTGELDIMQKLCIGENA